MGIGHLFWRQPLELGMALVPRSLTDGTSILAFNLIQRLFCHSERSEESPDENQSPAKSLYVGRVVDELHGSKSGDSSLRSE